MAHFERIRDVVSGPFSSSLMQQRTAAGWQLVSIEWRRELPGDEAPSEGAFNEDIPYGLRISDDCQRLEFDPRERMVLTQMMDGGSGFPLLQHRQRSEREGISHPRRKIVESGFGLPDDSAADRNRTGSVLHRRVGSAARTPAEDRIRNHRSGLVESSGLQDAP